MQQHIIIVIMLLLFRFDKIGLVGCVLHRRSNALNTLLTFNITPVLGSGNIVNEYRV